MVKATVTDVVPAVLPGVFPARFDGVEEASNDSGDFWKWTFMLEVGVDFIGDPDTYGTADCLIPVTATSSPRITPRTKSAKWLEALTGKPMEVGADIDFDELVGTNCQVIIALSDTGYSRIDQVLPKPSKAK